MRMIIRTILSAIAGLVLLSGLVAASYAAPAPFFAHEVRHGALTLRADRPLDAAAAQTRLAEVADALAAGPFGAPEAPIDLLSADGGWRERLFFVTVPGAGGVTYAPVSHRNAFLVGMDEAADRLVKGGTVITPPRTLTYYMIHEAVHLQHARHLGTLAYQLQPNWVREGLADVVALGVMTPQLGQELVAQAPDGVASLEMMIAHGAYPLKRARLSAALARDGCKMDALLALRIWTEKSPCL